MSATGGSRRTKGMVQFADERGSPSPSPDFARGDKDDIRVIDEALAGGSDVDMFERQVMPLEDLKKHKSRFMRDNEDLQE